MKKEIVDLVEAVRGLQIKRTGSPAPHCVKIGVPPLEFPEKLEVLQTALERFDRSEGESTEDDKIEKYKKTIDALFKWMRVEGIPVDHPKAIIEEILSGKTEKKFKTFDVLPSFEPSMMRPKPWKHHDKFKLGSRLGTRNISGIGMASARRMGAEMDLDAMSFGDSLAKSVEKSTSNDIVDGSSQNIDVSSKF